MTNCCAFLSEKSSARPAREQEPLLQEDDATAPTKVEEALPGSLSMTRNRPFRSMLLPWILDQTLAAMLASVTAAYLGAASSRRAPNV